MIIAIDGPAASGKGTIAKRLAQHYGLPHLDTGLIYRAVAKAVLDAGHKLDDHASIKAAALALDPTRFDEVDSSVTPSGKQPRSSRRFRMCALRCSNFQQEFAASPRGAVLDGRDIGTVICPHADVKIFVTASPQERARRRTLELEVQGQNVRAADILADILRRDERDQLRSVAPLRPAADAFVLDTTDIDIEAAVAAAIARVEQVRR